MRARPIPFTGYPLDRADDVRKQPEALDALWDDARARVVALWRGKPAVTESAEGAWTSSADVVGEPWLRLFLGIDAEGVPSFAVSYDPAKEAPTLARGRFSDLRPVAGRLSLDDAALLGTARSVLAWHRSHRFCANCGSPSGAVSGGWKRRCPACGKEHFPRVEPVVIALVTHGDAVLLGRGPWWPEGFFSCLAGFVEPGETMGDATRREVLEEAGVEVDDVTYVFGQPWPFPASLMLGVQAEARSRDVTVDGVELAEARWFERDEVVAMLAGKHPDVMSPFPIAVAYHLLKHWVAETPED
ncbi:MAG: NAD(+) diphosphatase [Myxococcota bacterium]